MGATVSSLTGIGAKTPEIPPEDIVDDLDDDHESARDEEILPVTFPLAGNHLKASKTEFSDYDFPFENLVLEGGGNKGIAYVGALRVLESINITVASGKIKRLAGTSSGAMTAALVAIGYNSNDVEGFLSQDIEAIFLDSRFGYLSLVPNILSSYGWNPGNRIYEWFGEKVMAKLGDADYTFHQLLKNHNVELCVVVCNLNLMTAEFCHAKTTPDMPIRVAVRMSMSIPMMFAPKMFNTYGTEDTYVDGGVLCNFPLHAYDGWWLSLAKDDSFFNRVKGVKELNRLMQNTNRFGTYNKKTIGLMLYADDEEDLYRSKLQSRVGTKLHLKDIPDTVLGKAYRLEANLERTSKEEFDKLSNAFNMLLSVLSKQDTDNNEKISLDEFKAVLNDPEIGDDHKATLFGENYDLKSLFDKVSQSDESITFSDLLHYMQTKGLDLQSKLLGYKRRPIDSLSAFISSIQATLTTNAGRIFFKLRDVKRTVGINTGHVGTTDFDLEPEDRTFLVERGRKSCEAFLRYYIIWNKLQPKS